MDLLKVLQRIDALLTKESIYKSPEEKVDAVHDVQIELFDQLKPAYGVNQQLDDALLPFKKEFTFTAETSPGGLIVLPEDYLHLLAVRTVLMDGDAVCNPMAEKITEDQLGIRLDSALVPPSAKYPICIQKAGPKLQLYPAHPAAGVIYYLREPKKPVFAYTRSGRAITYDEANSVQLEWNESCTRKLILKAAQLLGVTVKDADVVSFTAAKEGQS